MLPLGFKSGLSHRQALRIGSKSPWNTVEGHTTPRSVSPRKQAQVRRSQKKRLIGGLRNLQTAGS